MSTERYVTHGQSVGLLFLLASLLSAGFCGLSQYGGKERGAVDVDELGQLPERPVEEQRRVQLAALEGERVRWTSRETERRELAAIPPSLEKEPALASPTVAPATQPEPASPEPAPAVRPDVPPAGVPTAATEPNPTPSPVPTPSASPPAPPKPPDPMPDLGALRRAQQQPRFRNVQVAEAANRRIRITGSVEREGDLAELARLGNDAIAGTNWTVESAALVQPPLAALRRLLDEKGFRNTTAKLSSGVIELGGTIPEGTVSELGAVVGKFKAEYVPSWKLGGQVQYVRRAAVPAPDPALARRTEAARLDPCERAKLLAGETDPQSVQMRDNAREECRPRK